MFLHRYVKHRGRRVRPYLLPVWRLYGNPLWRRHLVSVSRSQYGRYRGERDRREGKRETWKKGSTQPPILLLLYCWRKLLSIFSNIDSFLLEKQHALLLAHARLYNTLTFALHSDNCRIKCYVTVALTVAHSILEDYINAYMWSIILFYLVHLFSILLRYDNLHLDLKAAGFRGHIRVKRLKRLIHPQSQLFIFWLQCCQMVAHWG